MKRNSYFSYFVLSLLFVFPCLAMAQLKDENLLQPLPSGYKIEYQTKQKNMVMQEMVPNGETVENWTEMITTQIFQDARNADADQFQMSMKHQWIGSCKDSTVTAAVTGKENGYPFAFWAMHCPLNAATGQPEATYFKTIKGNDGFYVIQKAFKFEPTKEQAVTWAEYLRNLKVCDTRLVDRLCPDLRKQGFEPE